MGAQTVSLFDQSALRYLHSGARIDQSAVTLSAAAVKSVWQENLDLLVTVSDGGSRKHLRLRM
jgi:hypothetical protein